jgi:hypothetical protein
VRAAGARTAGCRRRRRLSMCGRPHPVRPAGPTGLRHLATRGRPMGRVGRTAPHRPLLPYRFCHSRQKCFVRRLFSSLATDGAIRHPSLPAWTPAAGGGLRCTLHTAGRRIVARQPGRRRREAVVAAVCRRRPGRMPHPINTCAASCMADGKAHPPSGSSRVRGSSMHQLLKDGCRRTAVAERC